VERAQLHVIVAPEPWLKRGPGRLARAVASAGADYLHLRAPGWGARAMLELGAELRDALDPTSSTRLVVNARIDVAAALGISALQMPEHCFSPDQARSLAGELLDAPRRGSGSLVVGASRHSAAGVADAVRRGADWIFLGHLFPTPSHPGAAALDAREIEAALTAAESVPLIAIGGVRAGRIEELLSRGFAGVAVQAAALDAPAEGSGIAAIRVALDRAAAERERT